MTVLAALSQKTLFVMFLAWFIAVCLMFMAHVIRYLRPRKYRDPSEDPWDFTNNPPQKRAEWPDWL